MVNTCRTNLPRFQAHLISKLEGIGKRGGEAKQLQWLDQISATGLQFKHSAKISERFMMALKSADRLTACWTVDDTKTAKRVADLGVDFITTNRPAFIRQQTAWSK